MVKPTEHKSTITNNNFNIQRLAVKSTENDQRAQQAIKGLGLTLFGRKSK